MGLFLLGIPMAIIGAKVLNDNIKYTMMDNQIPKASVSLSEQYNQINQHFGQILDYSGADCDLKKIGYADYEISNVRIGGYGGMERYLAEKGYYPTAIQYAKECFDNIGRKEQDNKFTRRDNRIAQFERKLATERCIDRVVTYEIAEANLIQPVVENEVQKLINYFKTHHNENAYCNIIMGDGTSHYKHTEVWHLKEPIGENLLQYYSDIVSKLKIKWNDD